MIVAFVALLGWGSVMSTMGDDVTKLLPFTALALAACAVGVLVCGETLEAFFLAAAVATFLITLVLLGVAAV